MSDTKPYWSVTVSIDGNRVLTIARDEYAGIPDIDKYAEQVRECARHLLAFIGEEDPEPFIVPDDDGQPDEMTEWRDYDADC